VVQAAQEAEQSLQARIGLAVLDTADGQLWQYRADERFPMASTSKALICSALLARGPGAMETAWLIKEEAIQSYAPTTENLIGHYVSAAQLCAITMRNSDNTAANGVLEMLGGPQAVTSFLRTIGDTVTRLDRNEPSLNEATPGDLRDTTTPQAMVQTLQSLVLGDALKTPDRDRLTDWLRHNEVGGPLLRAGVPESWTVADRTGAAGYGTRGETFVGAILPELAICRIQHGQTDTGLQGLLSLLCGLNHRMGWRPDSMDRPASHNPCHCQSFQSMCSHRPILHKGVKTRKQLAAPRTQGNPL
jgi:beta-lactamase class A/beta-lactamase class A CARB-5